MSVVDASWTWGRIVAASQPPLDNLRARASWGNPAETSPLKYGTVVFGIALAYFAAALIGNALRFTGNVDALWPPVGVGIALLLYFGVRFWPGVLMGDLLADIPHALPLGVSLGQTMGNMIEVVGATILITRLAGRAAPFARLPTVTRLVAILLGATAVSATVGTLSLTIGGVIQPDEMRTVWRTWWLADSCGALVIVPLSLAWARSGWPRWTRRRWAECTGLLVALVGVNLLASEARQPLSYIVFPVLVWAAMRFGTRGATFALTITALSAIWATAHRLGPFAMHSIDAETLRIQLYLGVAIGSTLFISVLAEERRTGAAELAASRARLLEAGDAARRRLERDLHDGAQQRLVALAMRLAGARHEQDLERAQRVMGESAQELGEAIEELREIAHGIHPTVLVESGLAFAIEELAARSNLSVQLNLGLPEVRLEPHLESTAYYVVAEALANAQKHSQASAVLVTATLVESMLRIEVRDNGVGGATAHPGSGLEGLRDRVEGFGGTLAIHSTAGTGTTIVARLVAPT